MKPCLFLAAMFLAIIAPLSAHGEDPATAIEALTNALQNSDTSRNSKYEILQKLQR